MQPQRRSKVFITVVIAVQTIVALLFLMFAFYQRAEAETQRRMAEANRRIAQKDLFMEREQRVRSEKLVDSLTIELNKLKALIEKK